MTEFVYIPRLAPSGLLLLADAERVADSLRRGGLGILPTETGYMLAAVATDVAAVEAAFAVKGRPHSNPMHVACSSLAMASSFARLGATAARILGHFTPGPVTVVVEKRDVLPDRLVSLGGTVGIRVPDCAATLQVIEAVGAPLTATSLNESGGASVSIDRAALGELAWPAGGVVHVVEGDDVVTRDSASTLVRAIGDGLEILRPGPVSKAEIEQAL